MKKRRRPSPMPLDAQPSLVDLLPPPAPDGDPAEALGIMGALLREPGGDAWTDEEVAEAAASLRPPSGAAAAFAAALMADGRHERAWAFAAPLLADGAIAPADALKLSEAAAEAGIGRRIAILSAGLRAYEDAFLYVERAKLRRTAGDLPDAVADAAEAARLAPTNAGVHCENVWTLLAAGAPQDGFEAAEAGLAHCPDEPGLLRALAVAEQARGNGAAAEAILRRSLEAGTADAETGEALRAIQARELERDLSAFSAGDGGGAVDAGRAQAFERRVRDLADAGEDGLGEARTVLDRLAFYRALPDAARAALFDEPFYRSQLGPDEAGTDDVVAHYALRGARRRLSPTPFFEPWTFLEAAGDPDLPDPLADALERDGPGLPFHPLAPAELSGSRGGGLLGLASAPDGDGDAPDAVRAAAREAARAVRARFAAATLAALPRLAVERALGPSIGDGATAAAAVAELFDARFYLDRLAERGLDVPPEASFEHYAREGWLLGLDPHPLFRTAFYVERTPSLAGSGLDPLTHYVLEAPEDACPHPLLEANAHDLKAALAAARRPAGTRLLEGYLAAPPAERPRFVKFFDPDYYRATVPEIDRELVDPLLHYLSVGFRRGASPHPAFDPDHVRSRLGSPEAEAAGLSPLELFELHPEPRPAPFALLDPDYYLALYPDLAKAKLCGASHFLRHGLAEGRRPNPLLLSSYVYAQEHETAFADRPPLWEYLARKRNRRRRIMFVGHDGTRTGAPAILYRLIKHMAAYEDVECLCVLDHGGPLVDDYAAVALTYVKPNGRSQLYAGKITREAYFAELDALMKLFDDNWPEIAVCNSAEIRMYSEYFKGRGIPVVALVHEIASIYPPGELETLATHSDKIVFPAEFVANGFRKAYRPRPEQGLVLPQGLLRDTYGDRPRGDRVDVFKAAEIDVADDDVIALACGTIDGRKGFDLFVRTARLVRDKRPDGRIRFIWIGGRRDWRMHGGAAYDSIGHWASWENLQADEDLVHVVAEVRDTEAFLVNADLFLMTSRVDPFPCVVHEAMASRLPVLCFEGTGGSPEAIRDDAGLVLPYLDCEAMADAIVALAEDPERRAAMGEAGRARIKTEYRFAAYAEKVKGLLEAELGVGPSHYGRDLARRTTRGRVYFGLPSWVPGGVNGVVETLARRLSADGFEAEILLTRGRFGASAENGEVLPDAPRRLIQPVTADPQESLARVKNFLSDQAPCVFAPGLDPALRALTAELPPNVAVLGLVSADEEEQYDAAYRLGLFWNRIVAASDEVAAQLVALNPAFAPKVEVIRFGLDAPSAEDGAAADADRDAAAVVRVVVLGDGAGGSQARGADHCRLVEVLAQRGVPFELTMAAEAADGEATRGRLRPFVRAGLVRLAGRLDEAALGALLARSHLAVSLSSSPRATLGAVQALQHGCAPVLFERSGGVSELIRHGVNGFTTPRGRIEAVAGIVERLAGDREARVALAREARATVAREGLTTDEMCRRYAAVVDGLLAAVEAGDYPRRSFAGAR